MKKFGLLYGTFIALFIGVVLLSFKVSAKLEAYKLKKEQIAEEMGFEERLLSVWEYIPGLNTGAEKVEQWQKMEKEAKAKYNGALVYSGVLFALVLLFAGINVGYYKKKEYKYQVYGLVLVFASLSFLYLGLQSPFIEIMAFKRDLAFDLMLADYEFEGRTYFLYQNKSILELVTLLYRGGNYFVAIAVVIFSVFFPVFKAIFSFVILLKPEKPSNIRNYKMVRNLGKWSMIDVFTASIFLAVFAFSNMEVGVDTGSETLVGTYFYITFVILSINSSLYLKKTLKKVQELNTWDLD